MSFWLLQAGGWAAFVAALLMPWLGASPIGPMLARKIPVTYLGLLTTLGLRLVYRSVVTVGRLMILASSGVARHYGQHQTVTQRP